MSVEHSGAQPPQGGGLDRSATTGGGGHHEADLAQAITLLRARIDEEFQVSNRLDSKQRQAFALATAFFAIVQTVAFGAMDTNGVTQDERILIGLTGVVAGAFVVWVATRLIEAESLKSEDDVKPEAIVGWYETATKPTDFAGHAVQELRVVAERRRDSNKVRADRVRDVQGAAALALVFTGVELLAALVVKTFGG
jgi:hypothetical protein